MSSLLSEPHKGPLRVIINTLTGDTGEFTPDLIGEDNTFFDYLSHSCACLFTNSTTRLSVSMRAEDWKVVRFSATEQVLEVEQVGGEPLGYEPDDEEKYHQQFGYPDEVLRPFLSPN